MGILSSGEEGLGFRAQGPENELAIKVGGPSFVVFLTKGGVRTTSVLRGPSFDRFPRLLRWFRSDPDVF